MTAGRTADGRVEVFVIDNAGTLWNIRQTAVNGPWSGWNSFGSAGGGLDDRPALARNADGRLTLFVRSNDGALWSRTQTQVSAADDWSGWVSEGTAGGGFFDHPVVGPSADGRLNCSSRPGRQRLAQMADRREQRLVGMGLGGFGWRGLYERRPGTRPERG